MLKDLRTRLADKQLTIEVSDKAKDYIIDHGFDPAFGARPLKRFIQSNVETLIAKKIIAADIADDKILHVDAGDSGLYVS
jgi:ATP-dependent Clp protease ATP-binding subunit ClpB